MNGELAWKGGDNWAYFYVSTNMKGVEENTKILSQCSWCPDRGLNLAPWEYEAELLTNALRRAVVAVSSETEEQHWKAAVEVNLKELSQFHPDD
jgi:hypothetical protein